MFQIRPEQRAKPVLLATKMLAIAWVAAHAFCPLTIGGRPLTTTRQARQHVLAVASTLPDEEERLGVAAERSLETEDSRLAAPPPRGVDVGGYVCPPEKCTWLPFQYALSLIHI